MRKVAESLFSKLESGLVRIYTPDSEWNGTGFAVAGEFIITCAHVLAWIPDAGNLDVPYTHVQLGSVTGTTPQCVGRLIFYDSCNGVAIIASPDEQDFAKEAEKYDALCSELKAVKVRGEYVKPRVALDALVRNCDGKWLNVKATKGAVEPSSLNLIMENVDERTPAGTSGSPVFDTRGRVIGVLKVGVETSGEAVAASVPDNFPLWLARRLKLVKD